jgi:hypothetical protein
VQDAAALYPAAISYALAADRTLWTKPRVVLLCRQCAAKNIVTDKGEAEGGYYSE